MNANSAPKLEAFLAAPELWAGYLVLCPNGKLPPKHHTASLLAENGEVQQIFFSQVKNASAMANIWGGHIRTCLAKLRDVKRHDQKLAVLKAQASGELVHGRQYSCLAG